MLRRFRDAGSRMVSALSMTRLYLHLRNSNTNSSSVLTVCCSPGSRMFAVIFAWPATRLRDGLAEACYQLFRSLMLPVTLSPMDEID